MHRRTQRGFTLLEALVVIGIVSILIALLMPALGAARTQSRQALSMSNLRTIGLTFDSYASAYRTYPFPGRVEPSAMSGGMSVEWYPQGTVVATNRHWSMSTLWPGVVSAIAPWEDNFENWISPGLSTDLPEAFSDEDVPEPLDLVSYAYSNSFLARPELWLEDVDTKLERDPRVLVTGTRPDQVAFTSQKVMLWDRHLGYRTGDIQVVEGHLHTAAPMAFADLHVGIENPTKAASGWINPLNGGDIRRLHNTPEGIRGTDF